MISAPNTSSSTCCTSAGPKSRASRSPRPPMPRPVPRSSTRLGLEQAGQFVSSFDRPNIRYRIVEKANPRQQLIAFLRNEHPGDAGIVYCLSRRKVEETATYLATQGMTALPYHAGLPAETRRNAPGAVSARGGCGHRRDHRLRDGDRQAGRALRRPSGPAQKPGGLLSGDRTRRPGRSARRCLDDLWLGRRGDAASHDRGLRGRGALQARGDAEARQHARLLRDHRMSAPGSAQLFRRASAQALRQLRHLPGAGRHLGRDAGGTEGALLHLSHRPALRQQLSGGCPARQGQRAHPPLRT